MANTYNKTRLTPLVQSLEVGGELKDNVITHLVIGVTATAEDGYSSYIDARVALTVDPENFIEFKRLCEDPDEKWQNDIADKHIAENNWHEVLDKQIEAKRLQPLPRSWVWEEPTPNE